MVNSVKEINTTSELQDVVHDVLEVEHLMIMVQMVEVVTSVEIKSVLLFSKNQKIYNISFKTQRDLSSLFRIEIRRNIYSLEETSMR